MMKLYAFSCGRIRCRKNVFVPDAPKDVFIDAPMPVYLITHPEGNVLFDTGPHPEVFKDTARWGGLAKAFAPIGDETSGVVDQLKKVGMTPGDIRYVVNSHLHFDHCGGNGFFNQSTFLVSKKDLECASSSEFEGKGYFRADWDHRALIYQEIEGELDIYGDNSLRIIPMPGHTLGHQILLVRLKEKGAVILSGDSVPCSENYVHGLISRNNMDNDQAARTIHNLHELVDREKAWLIHGHDPDQWKTVKQAPEYYE
ncbi:MAG: N-acyl homoserine lactonase family protein [Thermodesulfobacteriota bacterium]